MSGELKSGTCAFCGNVVWLLPNGQPPRDDTCAHCHANLHSCRQCRFYDPRAPQGCQEPRAELVSDKANANFCDFFEFIGGSASPEAARADAAKSALEKLFGKD